MSAGWISVAERLPADGQEVTVQFAEVVSVRIDLDEVVTTLRRITREQAHG